MLYKDSGVDITKGERFVAFIKQRIKKKDLFYPDFALSLPLDDKLKGLKDPYLVYSTDGVGTKIKLAMKYNRTDSLGQDLVAMCVNDILVLGAKPMVFLDYIATDNMDNPYLVPFMDGLLRVLEAEKIELGGGETAELPDLLNKDEFDVAGFVVGVVSKNNMTKKENVKEGDVIIGIPSSGVHSNGYSLVRAILNKNRINPEKVIIEDKKLIDVLLEPTIIYTRALLPFFEEGIIHGAAHITGGGIPGNLVRTLNNKVDAVVYREKIKILPVFKYIQEKGGIPEDEMWRVFNMGVGFIVITDKGHEHKILENTDAYIIGEVKRGTGRVSIV